MLNDKIHSKILYKRIIEKISKGLTKELSDEELLAIVLDTYKGSEPIKIGHYLLSHYSLYENILHASIEELISKFGLSKKQSMRILAALEMAKRLHDSYRKEAPLLNTTKKIIDYIRPIAIANSKEVLYILFLNNSLHLKGFIDYIHGTDNEIHIYIRELIKTILKGYSANIVLVHNHLEKYPEATLEDITITRHIKEKCEYFNIRLLEHFIISENGYISLSKTFNLNSKN